jgi:hypothetical protein
VISCSPAFAQVSEVASGTRDKNGRELKGAGICVWLMRGCGLRIEEALAVEKSALERLAGFVATLPRWTGDRWPCLFRGVSRAWTVPLAASPLAPRAWRGKASVTS